MIGPHAEETIDLFVLAMRQHLTARDLREMLSAYPIQGLSVGDMR